MLGKNDVSNSISNVHPGYLVGVRPTKEAIVHMKARETFILKRPNHSLLNPDVTKLSTVPHLRPKVNDVYLISNEGDRTRTNDWPCNWYSWKNRSGLSKTIESKTMWCQNRFKEKTPTMWWWRWRANSERSTGFCPQKDNIMLDESDIFPMSCKTPAHSQWIF